MSTKTDGASRALLLPFQTGALTAPGGSWLFSNAAPLRALAQAFEGADLVCEQADRAVFGQLGAAGFATSALICTDPPARFEGAMLLLGKHRRVNAWSIARASRLVVPGGPIIVSGDKKLGAASVRKWVVQRNAIDGTISKHHAQMFWFAANATAFADVDLPSTEPAPGFMAAPGMFSADHVDVGSAVLAEQIDHRVAGHVADFGAGWGYLAAGVLSNGNPQSLDLIDAHAPSLTAAAANLKDRAGEVPVNIHWLDIITEPAPARYDWIVMNPPFHVGRKAEPDLGQRFIGAAAAALKPGGHLLMVANRTMPYETAITDCFADMRLRAERAGFKVIEASRPLDKSRS